MNRWLDLCLFVLIHYISKKRIFEPTVSTVGTSLSR
jgi:hypothetical protein